MALRDSSASRTGRRHCAGDHLNRPCRRSALDRDNPGDLGLAAARHFVLNRAWRIVTAHRVRVGCAEAMIYSSRGKIPIILWTAHQPFGERVLLMVPGRYLHRRFHMRRAILISACWAQDMSVPISQPHLVTLDVIRRPPAGPPASLRSTAPLIPLAGHPHGLVTRMM